MLYNLLIFVVINNRHLLFADKREFMYKIHNGFGVMWKLNYMINIGLLEKKGIWPSDTKNRSCHSLDC